MSVPRKETQTVVVLSILEAWGLVCNETDALHLTPVVESDDSDEGGGVFLLALFNLLQHLSSVGASEHGELPHGPVASIVVSWGPMVLTVHKSVLYHIEFR